MFMHLIIINSLQEYIFKIQNVPHNTYKTLLIPKKLTIRIIRS
jgi:hypothetical protein